MLLLQHYFAKAFNPTKNTIVDTIRIVVEDMKVIWVTVICPASCLSVLRSWDCQHGMLTTDRLGPTTWHDALHQQHTAVRGPCMQKYLGA